MHTVTTQIRSLGAFSTPDIFNWCRTELFESSRQNLGRVSGICNSNGASAPALVPIVHNSVEPTQQDLGC